MRVSELIVKAIDCFYIRPVRALMPLQVFRYAVCGGVTYILFDPLCYFLFYNFIVAHRYFDLGFVVVSPRWSSSFRSRFSWASGSIGM